MGNSGGRDCGMCCEQSGKESDVLLMKSKLMSPRELPAMRGIAGFRSFAKREQPDSFTFEQKLEEEKIEKKKQEQEDMERKQNLCGVGLVFKTTRDGKMVRFCALQRRFTERLSKNCTG